jgi:hypothetical protein
MAARFYVYVYRDPRPGKNRVPIYVGKGSSSRFRVHWDVGAKNPFLRNILGAIRALALLPEIEFVDWFDHEDDAFAAEVELIAKYGRRDKGQGTLANLTDGGEGPSGMRFSAATRERLAKLSKDSWANPAQRALRLENLSRALREPKYRALMAEITRARMAAPAERELRSKLTAQYWADPEHRAIRARNVGASRRTPEARAAAREHAKRLWERPEHRINLAEKGRIRFADLSQRAAMAERVKAFYVDNPEAIARSRAGGLKRATPEALAEQSLKLREHWAKPGKKAQQSERMLEYFSGREPIRRSAEVRAKKSLQTKAHMADPANRAKVAEGMRKRWADPDFRAQQLEKFRVAQRERDARSAGQKSQQELHDDGHPQGIRNPSGESG